MMGAKPHVAPRVSSTKISWHWGGSAALHLGKGSGGSASPFFFFFFFFFFFLKKNYLIIFFYRIYKDIFVLLKN
jgi:hypothetical protein